MRYLLDTNVVIALSKGAPMLQRWLRHCPADDLALSSIVLAELEYGIAKSARQAHNRRVFDSIIEAFAIIPFDRAAAREYGVLRTVLERVGRPIGPNDLLIAAHARALNLTLVTDNTTEFTRVEGLRLENWLQQPPM